MSLTNATKIPWEIQQQPHLQVTRSRLELITDRRWRLLPERKQQDIRVIRNRNQHQAVAECRASRREIVDVPLTGDDHRFRVIHADGASHLAQLSRRKSVILVDAYDREGLAAGANSVEFYRVARARLSADGVLVANLCGDTSSTCAQLANIREAFDGELFTARVGTDENVIVFAFKGGRPVSRWTRIEKHAEDLKRLFQLDFPGYARRIADDSRFHESHSSRGAEFR